MYTGNTETERILEVREEMSTARGLGRRRLLPAVKGSSIY